eukprot:COSAG05_NODE_49_length_24373_cov_16.162561_22_plen_107_part_00
MPVPVPLPVSVPVLVHSAAVGLQVFADGLGQGTVIEFTKKRLIGNSTHLLRLDRCATQRSTDPFVFRRLRCAQMSHAWDIYLFPHLLPYQVDSVARFLVCSCASLQ